MDPHKIRTIIDFYWPQIFKNVGKFPIGSLEQIYQLAPPDLKPQIKSLINRVKITRILNTISSLSLLIPQVWLFITIANKDIYNYILGLSCFVCLQALHSAIANFGQDSLFLVDSLLVKIITFSLNRKNCSPRIYDKTKELRKQITDAIGLERQSNLWIILFINLIVFSYLFHHYYNLNWIIVLLSYSTLAVIVFTIVYTMQKLYQKFSNTSVRIKQTFANNFTQQSTQNPIPISNKCQHTLLFRMTINKIAANSYSYIFILILLLLLLHQNPYLSIVTVLAINLMIQILTMKLYFLLKQLPRSLAVQKNILNPLLKEVATKVPSPITQPGTIDQNKDFTIKELILDKTQYTPPDQINQKEPKITINLTIPIKAGLYTITGDSGEGKSLSLSLIGNLIFPTKGQIWLKTDKHQKINYSDLGYWSIYQKIVYAWITEKQFTNTTPIKLFRSRLLSQEQNHYFAELMAKHDLDGLCTQANLAKYKNFLLNSVIKTKTPTQEQFDQLVRRILQDLLFKTKLFRSDEKHILTTSVEKLSGGQQARLLTALFLTGPQQLVMLDEGLERTTQNFNDYQDNSAENHNRKSHLYTRDRLIQFICSMVKKSNKTVMLLIQGGSEELNQVKKELGKYYLGDLQTRNAHLELIN